MSNELFAAALGVEAPWYVKDVAFDAGKQLLTVAIDFKRAAAFPTQARKGCTRFTTPKPSATDTSTSSSTNVFSKCACQGSSSPMAGWF